MKQKKKLSTKGMAEQMAFLTCELARTCHKKENYFASMFNLTPAEFRCLRLFQDKTSLAVKDIVAEVELTPGRITHILTSLEEKKFVKRKLDKKDKRNVIVDLTSKSIPFIKNLNASHIKLHEEILSKIKPDMKETVIEAMKEVIFALRSWTTTIDVKK